MKTKTYTHTEESSGQERSLMARTNRVVLILCIEASSDNVNMQSLNADSANFSLASRKGESDV